MHEIDGDLFEHSTEAIVIPTNGVIRTDGAAVMGSGLAKAAAYRFKDLAAKLGFLLRRHGNHCYIFREYSPAIITFPSKEHYASPSTSERLETSLRELVLLVDLYKIQSVALPEVGCGLGGLDWRNVKPLLERYLDDRFTVVHY